MSKKYPKSDLPENIAKPHRAALRNSAKKPATEGIDVNKDEQPERVILKSETKRKTTRPRSSPAARRKPIEALPNQGLKQSDIVAFNCDAEHKFVLLIAKMLQEDGSLSYREAIIEAAFELDVSPATSKRYLDKHSARRAEFSITDGFVTLRRAKS